jgi:hypothetical protein
VTTPTSTSTTTSDDLAAFTDRHEIETLVHRVGAALDDGRFDDLRLLYTDDAVVRTPGGVSEGIDALVAQAARTHSPDDGIQHLITGVLIDLDPGGAWATVRANHVAVFADRDPASAPLTPLGPELPTAVGAVYRFTARRTAGGWRLTSMVTEPVWASFSAVTPVRLPASRPAA